MNVTKDIESIKLYKDKVYKCVGDEYALSSVFTKNKRTYLELTHNTCGYRYDVEQYHFITNNRRCPNCRGKRISNAKTKTLEQFKKEIYNLVNNEYVVIGEYNGTHVNTTFRHMKCGRYFEKHPNNFLKGQRCPYCIKPSKGEQRIMDFLDKVMPQQYIFQMSYDNLVGVNDRKLSYDFYLPTNNLLIEYQGQFHDGSVEIQTVDKFEYQKEHDKRKKEYAQDNNIKLLEIWYWDFENIEEILKKELGIS